MKLACPEKTVVCLTGDGSYMFSVPSTVHWMARKYQTPFLTVIYNNRGWRAPKFSMLAVHPEGYASKAQDIDVAFDPPPDYSGIAAAAGGAFARIVKKRGRSGAGGGRSAQGRARGKTLRGSRRLARAPLVSRLL